jgi:hypothetical protein
MKNGMGLLKRYVLEVIMDTFFKNSGNLSVQRNPFFLFRRFHKHSSNHSPLHGVRASRINRLTLHSIFFFHLIMHQKFASAHNGSELAKSLQMTHCVHLFNGCGSESVGPDTASTSRLSGASSAPQPGSYLVY